MVKMEKVYPAVFGLLMLIMVILAVYSIINSKWSDLFVIIQALVISGLPHFLEKRFAIYTPYLLRTGFILFMFMTLILGEIADLYNTFWWWDVALHFVSSAGITVIGFILISLIYRDRDLKASPWVTSFLVFSFAICLAVIWEVYEFLIDVFFEPDTPMQLSNTDTMSDLIIATVGSLAVTYYGFKHIKKYSTKSIVEETIEEGKVNNL